MPYVYAYNYYIMVEARNNLEKLKEWIESNPIVKRQFEIHNTTKGIKEIEQAIIENNSEYQRLSKKLNIYKSCLKQLEYKGDDDVS